MAHRIQTRAKAGELVELVSSTRKSFTRRLTEWNSQGHHVLGFQTAGETNGGSDSSQNSIEAAPCPSLRAQSAFTAEW
eukprot:CAMPEP_0177766600 /NCGR_PEP_ID=MMETSP0491_2-20121128/8607_1 /TAXON_ID=63592 /ORGANISM="Tetraselmis chuii, Strain PLY429" /LENGTH=77 /DNA_ID=CAMNT_0019283017 /DNA_START=60 /DNA_END=290 /DNA_ORIENTATION=-